MSITFIDSIIAYGWVFVLMYIVGRFIADSSSALYDVFIDITIRSWFTWVLLVMGTWGLGALLHDHGLTLTSMVLWVHFATVALNNYYHHVRRLRNDHH